VASEEPAVAKTGCEALRRNCVTGHETLCPLAAVRATENALAPLAAVKATEHAAEPGTGDVGVQAPGEGVQAPDSSKADGETERAMCSRAGMTPVCMCGGLAAGAGALAGAPKWGGVKDRPWAGRSATAVGGGEAPAGEPKPGRSQASKR